MHSTNDVCQSDATCLKFRFISLSWLAFLAAILKETTPVDEHILLGYRDQRARTRLQSGYSNEVGAMIKLADTAALLQVPTLL